MRGREELELGAPVQAHDALQQRAVQAALVEVVGQAVHIVHAADAHQRADAPGRPARAAARQVRLLRLLLRLRARSTLPGTGPGRCATGWPMYLAYGMLDFFL